MGGGWVFCCCRGELLSQVCRPVAEAGARPHSQDSAEEAGGAQPPVPAAGAQHGPAPGTKGGDAGAAAARAAPGDPGPSQGDAAAGGEETEARGQLQMEAGRGIGQG